MSGAPAGMFSAAPASGNPLFNAAPTNGQPFNSPTNAPNPYMSGSLFQSAPMASAPIQNVAQPVSATPTLLPWQQSLAQFIQRERQK